MSKPDHKTDKSSDQVTGQLTGHEVAPKAANPKAPNSSAANLAGFCARRQHPRRTRATASVAPFYVETEAG
jgi:hypothetical protein